MNASQMKYEFSLIYELDNLMSPGLNDRQISTFLTQAQLEFVTTHYNPFGNKYQKGFEQSEKRRKDLSGLTENYRYDLRPISIDLSNKDNGYYVLLPEQFMWAINEELITNISKADCVRLDLTTNPSTSLCRKIEVRPITHDEYNANIDNPYKKPYDRLAWRLDVENSDYVGGARIRRHEIITGDDYKPYYYVCRYIRKPRPIIVPTSRTFTIDNIASSLLGTDCLLDDSIHMEIVRRSVKIATSITNQQEYPLKQNEVTQSE